MWVNNHILKFSVGLFFLASPIESIPIIEHISIVKFSAIIVLIVWILSGSLKMRNKSVSTFYPFLIFAILSCLWSIDIEQSFNALITFLFPSLLIAAIIDNSISSKKDIEQYLAFYIIGCIIASIFGLFERQSILAAAAFADQERLTALGQDQNTLTYLLIMGMVPLLHLVNKTSKTILKYSSIILVFLFSYIIVSAGSRTGVIVLVLIVMLYLYSIKNFGALTACIILSVIGIPILIRYIPEGVIERLMQTSDLVSEGNFTNREIIWTSALQAFRNEDFLFGVGYSNFSTMLKQHFGWQAASHNTYLTYLVEFGIIGVWTFVYVLIKIFRIARCIQKQEKSVFVYCYIIPLFIFMTMLEIGYKRWIFILYVLLSAWYRLNREGELKKIS